MAVKMKSGRLKSGRGTQAMGRKHGELISRAVKRA